MFFFLLLTFQKQRKIYHLHQVIWYHDCHLDIQNLHSKRQMFHPCYLLDYDQYPKGKGMYSVDSPLNTGLIL